MKVSYSYASGRVSSHCITWTQEKKRHRKYFRSRIEALKFRNDKEQELGIRDRQAIENEVIFWVLSEIKDKLDLMEGRLEQLEKSFANKNWSFKECENLLPPKSCESRKAKVLRISSRKLYYLLDKGVFKRYKLPHTRTTFIKLDEVEKP